MRVLANVRVVSVLLLAGGACCLLLLVQQATGLFSSPPRWTLLVNNALGCADDTTLMAESEDELKSLLMKVRGE